MRYFIFLALLLLLFPKISFSHKVNTFAYREGNQIIGEAYFADGSPCIKCSVEVYNKDGVKIFQTTTDEKGKYTFSLKEKGPLTIKVIAGEGHLAEYRLETIKEETLSSSKKETSEKEIPSQSPEKIPKISKISPDEEIKQIVKDAVKEVVKDETEGTKTLLMEIKRDMDKVRLHDIIGGIGYIFGVWGIITVLKFRKNNKN